MADVNIDMMLSDSTRSIGRRRREIEGLNQALERTRSLMASQASGGGGGGGGGEREGYDRVRGTVGTGAAGRDFANQAQGLGGVVRLYATFAANIFAVGAAFQNLQQAANFERLIKASELMSERTGVNLKGLGKDLQAATGYAISFEDAMQFANLGTSAGIAAKQMTSLVEIAKGAAAGLGRDVNDSVRRIIQGTAKQEQEILDELGIFIKAKDAYEQYARKFNITGGADALSAQQRVAAYANAVEQAGEKWKDFAKIEDPFSKFIATGKEALMEMLNFINQGVKPLLAFLAQSKDAIIALASVISLSLARRALPELKNLFTDLFTYNKARMQAQAQQQRMDIAREMATTSNLIQAEQAKLQAIQAAPAVSPAIIRSSFGQGTVSPGGRSGLPGISEQRLTSAIFGTRGNPVDLASYQKAEDLEKKINKAVRETIGSNQVKLDQLKALGVVTQASTLQQVQLSAATIASSKKIFDAIQNQNTSLTQQEAVRAEILRLTNLQAAAQQRLAATTPGSVQATSRFSTPAAPAAPIVPAAGTSTTAAVMGAITSRVVDQAKQISAAYTKAVAEIGENTKQMNNVIGGGFMVNLKQAGLVLRDHFKVTGGFLRDFGTSLQMTFGRGASSATRWAAANVAAMSAVSAGTSIVAAGLSTVGLAIKGLMASLGPLMLLWAAWDLLLKDLVLDDVAKQTIEVTKKLNDLEEASKTAAMALAGVNQKLYDGVQTQEDYAKVVEVVKNSVISQIDAVKKLFKEQENLDKLDKFKKAEGEYASKGKFFSTEIYFIDQLIEANTRLRLSDKNTTDALIAARDKLEAAQKSKRVADIKSEFLLPTSIKNFLGIGYTEDQLKSRRSVAEAARELEDPLSEVRASAERREAAQAAIKTANKSMDDALAEMRSKLKKLPTYGEIATNETSKVFADGFANYEKIFREAQASLDPKLLESNYSGLIKKLQELAQYSPVAAQAVLDLNIAQMQGTDTAGLFQMALANIPGVLKDLNTAFAQYSAASTAYFNSLEKSIQNFTLSIARQDMILSKTSAYNDRIEAIRGYASEQEINSLRIQQAQKAEMEYSKELKQAQLEYEKVMRKGMDTKSTPATQEEKDAADQKLKFAQAQAAISRDQKLLTAGITAENKVLESTLKQIGFRYEEINRQVELQNARTEGALRMEQERLRILREAGALSEPRLVEMEAAGQGRQIQQQYEQATVAAANAAQREADEMNARYDLALLLAKTDEERERIIAAQGTALERLNQRERDAIALAGIRKDNELQVLKLTTEVKKIYAEAAEAAKRLAEQEALKQEQFNTETQLLDILKQELTFKRDMGMITEEAYNKEVQGLEKSMRAREFNNKQLEIERNYKAEIARIDAAEKAATATSLVEDREGNKVIDPQQLVEFERQRTAAGLLRDTQRSGARQVYEGNEKLRDQMASMGEDQMKLRDIYKSTFSSMGDALVDFVRTGKLNFKSLINDMLASIAKLYMNKIFMNLFSSLLPGLPGTGATPGLTSFYGVPNATGNVYSDTGIMKFAKGGTFTNSIVDSPTLFKFAKGTGLMGEAGPEAIMPLKRDGQGNLGVRGTGGGNVEVVVNNYSTAKAETKESTDGRGNRKIEVVIGDMTAGEVSRSGSMTNRAIQGTFGIQPQLIRR